MSLREACCSFQTSVLITALTLVSGSVPASADSIPLPGGATSLARFFVGAQDNPEEALLSLNRLLLTEVHPDNDWQFVPERVELVQYLKDLESLRKQFLFPLVLQGNSKDTKRLFQQLASEAGYSIRARGGTYEIAVKNGGGDERRRRVAAALGWDMRSFADDLQAGSSVELVLSLEQVDLPFSRAEWDQITRHPVPPDEVLQDLAKDQKLSLVVEGSRRLSAEARSAVGPATWTWLYKEAAAPFYRYGSAIEVRNNDLVLPGGPDSHSEWAELLEVAPTLSPDFLRVLLKRRNARPAYFWHALHFVPDDVARFYLGVGETGTAGERQFARGVFRRLDDTSQVRFDLAFSRDQGFGTLVRSLPLTEDRTSLDLPGGPRAWFVGIRAAAIPTSRSALARLVEKGSAEQFDPSEFVLKSLTEKVNAGPFNKPVLPRLVRAANLFPYQRGLLTSENIMMVSRTADAFPSALLILDELTFEKPETISSYLVAVAHLDELLPGSKKELLITNFQGGVEWLRSMARAGKVDHRLLESSLGEWARLHQRVTDPFDAAFLQLAWIVQLLEKLPQATPAAPGRGPLEQALIPSIVGLNDPQEFTFEGLKYEGQRGRSIESAMAERLVHQGIPSADQLGTIHGEFSNLSTAVGQGQLDDAHSASETLLSVIQSLPEPAIEWTREDRDLWGRILPVDRQRLTKLLQDIHGTGSANRLPSRSDEVTAAERLLAREIRPFLLAPSYLIAMRDEDNPLFDDPNLIRKHLLYESLEQPRPNDNPWASTEVNRDPTGKIGAQLVGYVGDVAAPMAEFSLALQAGPLLRRDRLWFRDYATTPWAAIQAATNRMVTLALETGSGIIEQARLGGSASPAFEFASKRIPIARLENEVLREQGVSLLGPSEVFALGLAALHGDGHGKGDGILVSEDQRSEFKSLCSSLGPDWKTKLDLAGAATPDLNGKAHRWVGTWAPYEAVERERHTLALFERELLDLRIALLGHMGQHGLPGEVGADLMPFLLSGAGSEMRLENDRDWEGHLRWVNQLDVDYFDEKLRQCFSAGLYSVADF